MIQGVVLFMLLALPQKPPAPHSPQVPARMGLWEFSTTISHANAGSSAPVARTVKERMCVTPETVPPQLLGQASKLCTPSNVHKEGDHVTMDLSCPTMTSHVDTQTISPELSRMSIHATMTNQGKSTVIDSVIQSRFLNSSCGSVQPGQPVLVP